jgi:fluoride ion exporter CrcB/FEX
MLHTVLASKTLIFALAGAAGAIARACISGFIELPKRKGHKIALGFLSDLVLGIILGIIVDQSPIIAFSAAFAGRQAVEDIVRQFLSKKVEGNE